MTHNEKLELLNINIVKGIMMLCVVLCHSCAMFTNSGWGSFYPVHSSKLLGLFSDWIGTFHIQFFTFASGYLFYVQRYELGKYRNGFSVDVSHRAKRLLIPYLIFAIFWAIPAYCIIHGIDIHGVATDFLLAKSPAQLWFLIMLFGEYVIFYLASDRILKMPGVVSFFAFLAMYYGSIILSRFPTWIMQMNNILQYTFFFYLGFIWRSKDGIPRLNKYLCVILHFVTAASYFYLRSKDGVVYLASYLVRPFVSISAIFTIMGIVITQDFSSNKLFRKLVSLSFGIYLVHQQIVYFLMRLFDQFNALPSVIIAVLIFAITLLLSVLLVTLLQYTRLKKYIS